MVEIKVYDKRKDVDEYLNSYDGEDSLIVISPPEEFNMPMYHVVCPTWEQAVKFQEWAKSQESQIAWGDISESQEELAPKGLFVFTVVPRDKKLFPKPEEWNIE